jgi:hypothetical protein
VSVLEGDRRPNGYERPFTYSGDGRLKTHSDPPGAGGVREFTREYLPNNAGYKVKALAIVTGGLTQTIRRKRTYGSRGALPWIVVYFFRL